MPDHERGAGATDVAGRWGTAAAIAVLVVAMVALSVLALANPSPSNDPRAGAPGTADGAGTAAATNPMFDAEGRLVKPLPALADRAAVTANPDGSSQVTFGIAYEVSNPGPGAPRMTVDGTAPRSPGTVPVLPPADRDGPKPDIALVTVMVAPTLAPGGPIRLRPLFRQTVVGQELLQASTTASYSFRLPPNATRFLRDQGLPLGTSGSPTETTGHPALRHIDIDVQQMRDHKVVDGVWDWQQGRAYTAADAPPPTTPSTGAPGRLPGAGPAGLPTARSALIDVTDDSTVTVTNNTGSGLWGPAQNTSAASGEQPNESATLLQATDAYQTNISLAGTAVECIDQGQGSNPAGFSMLNGWDIIDGLAPGTVPPGASVTQQVTANESLGTASLDVTQSSTEALVQVLAAVGDYTLGGVKDAVTTATLLAMGLAEFSTPVTIALAVPIMAILGLIDGIYQAMTDSCASFANMFNISAAEPLGSMASYTWGDQTNGLVSVFDSASFGGTAVTDNVQLAASTGIVSFLLNDAPATVHPYLEQVATTACGTGCPSSTNNVIDINWSAGNPCPTTPSSNCLPQQSSVAGLPEVSVPGTSLCGPSNELCTTLATPNTSASEVNAESASNFSGSPYEVVAEYQPSSPVVALAAASDTTIYGGSSDGTISMFTPESAIVPVLTNPNLGAMTFYQDQLVYSSGSGIYSFDPDDPQGTLVLRGATGDDDTPASRMVEVGGLVYVLDGTQLYALTSDWSLNAIATDWAVDGAAAISMTASPSYLFVGFDGGYVERCDLTDCAGTWVQVHDGGFNSNANALTAVGDTLYIGLENGAIAQLDGNSGATTMISQAGSEGLAWGGMVTVDGNVYIGGCVGLQSPASGDLLGVVVLESFDGTEATFEPQAPYAATCQNPTETTTQYKGFDPGAYAMIATPATSTHPPLVFASVSIGSGNFVYALESVAPFTDSLCLGDDAPCPTAPAPPAPPPSVPGPVDAVAALGTPLMVASCGTPSFSTTTADSFTLTAPAGCTSTFSWDLNDAGSLPYTSWQSTMALTTGSSTTAVSFDGADQTDLTYTADPDVWAGGPQIELPAGGAAVVVTLGGATALVIAVNVPAGGSSATVTVTGDALES